MVPGYTRSKADIDELKHNFIKRNDAIKSAYERQKEQNNVLTSLRKPIVRTYASRLKVSCVKLEQFQM